MKFVVRLFCILILISSLAYTAQRETKGQGGTSARSLPPRTSPAVSLKKTNGIPLPAGNYNVGTGGYFPTLDSAFSRLSSGGISGAVTLMLTDTLYDALGTTSGSFKVVGPISGTGPSSRITIRPADNVAVRIEGIGSATLTFEDVSYLTLDGISLDGPTRLKVHTSVNKSYDFNDGIDLWGDCKYDVVRNLTAASDRIELMTAAILLASKDTTTVDSCVVSGVSITSGGIGIYVWGYNSLNRPKGNVIRGNHIGSPADSLISWGVQVEAAEGTIVENNQVEQLGRKSTPLAGRYSSIGINSYYGTNTIIRNNIVHGFRGDAGGSMFGILASGEQSKVGQGVQIYNNLVYDLQNKSTTTAGYIGGITLWCNNNPLIAYNSIRLHGTSADPSGSDALALAEVITNATIRNNILVNNFHITSSGGCTALWWAQGMSMTSDYNDLLVDTAFSNSVLVYGWNVGSYRTLSQWQGAGYDAHSVSVMPPFRSATDLHLSNALTPVADAASPIAGILTDFDGDARPRPGDLAPDIGADEFMHPTGIENPVPGLPGSFALEQNYPNPFNPRTVVSSQLPVVSNVKLVIYDVLGKEVKVLVNEKRAAGYYEDTFDASGLASGVYIYRLTAGSYAESRRMILLK